MRPQSGLVDFTKRAEGIAILMCIDCSGSMETADIHLDGGNVARLEAVRRVFHDFVEGKGELRGRPDDLIGLMAFGGYPESLCPLTLDHDALLELLDTVQVAERGAYEERLTAIGDALMVAIQRLSDKEVKAKSKIIILLSDGQQTTGVFDPLEAAKIAAGMDIKIYTVGLETNEPTLKSVADITGGYNFVATKAEGLKEACRKIDQELKKSPIEGRIYTQYRELFPYALLPGLGLVLLEFVLACTRFRSLL